jgi:hypothetical protein
MFHLDVSKIDLVLHILRGYTCMFQMHISSVSFVFRCMLHVFHLDVSRVDQMLHDVGGWQRAACYRALAPTLLGEPHPLSLLPSLPSISPWQFKLNLSEMGMG